MNSNKMTLQTTLRITHKQAEDLDYYAEKIGLSRNQLLKNLISCELDELAVLDKLGILRLGAGIRDLISLARNRDDFNAIKEA